MTEDVEGARAFYAEMFGWSYAQRPGGIQISEILADGVQIGLIVPASDGDPETTRSRWVTILGVEDAEVAARVAAKAGGKALLRTLETQAGGRFTVLADAEGAQFIAFSGDRPRRPRIRGSGRGPGAGSSCSRSTPTAPRPSTPNWPG